MYNTDGSVRDVYSFHDEAAGTAANYENITTAFTELASHSVAFRKTLKKLKNQSTYSNLNLNYEKIGKGLQEKYKGGKRQNNTSEDKYYDKRKFAYPVYLVSEDYHIIDSQNGQKAGI